MTIREQLLREINTAPDFLIEEVLDFLLFVKMRRQQTVHPVDAAEAIPCPQRPIWEAFEEFADQLPETIADTLPTDGAAQVDHYLYGSPKRNE